MINIAIQFWNIPYITQRVVILSADLSRTQGEMLNKIFGLFLFNQGFKDVPWIEDAVSMIRKIMAGRRLRKNRLPIILFVIC